MPRRTFDDDFTPRPGSATPPDDTVRPRPGKIVAGSFTPPLVVDPFASGSGEGGVASVSAQSPIESTGGPDPVISLQLPGQTEGDVLYFNGVAWTRLPAGIPGQVLTTEGTGAPPQWTTAGAGGVSDVTASSPIASSGGPTPNISFAIAGQTEGDVVYFDGAHWVRLPAGTPGQLLETQGAGGPPQWIPPPATGVTAVTGVAPITSTGGPTPAIGITAATEAAAGSMSAADKAKLDALGPGPIYPRSASNTGTGSAAFQPNNAQPGILYTTQAAFLCSLAFSPLQFTRGVAPSARSFGPFVWGARGSAADIFRFDVDNFLVDVVSLDDVSPGAQLGGARTSGGIAQGVVVVDGAGNAWTIETTSNTLVKIQAEAPQIAATFPIPNSPKNLLAYDPVHNTLILLNGQQFTAGATTIASFNIATGVFSADVAVGVGTQAPSSLFFAVDAAAPKGGWVFVGSSTIFTIPSTNDIFKLDPVTLATLATASFVDTGNGGTPIGFAYATNAPNPKLLVSLSSKRLARIDVNGMTVDATATIGVATSLAGIALSPIDGSLWLTDFEVTQPPSSVFYQVPNPLTFPTPPLEANIYDVSSNTDAIPGANTSGLVLVPAYTGNFGAVAAQFALASTETDEVTLIFEDLTGFPAPNPNIDDWIDIAGFISAIEPGTAGQVLTSQGPGQPPVWAASASSANYPGLPGTGTNAYAQNSGPAAPPGTIADVVPTQTTLGEGTSVPVDGFTSWAFTDSGAFKTIAIIEVPTSDPWLAIIDVSLSILATDTTAVSDATSGQYRSDLVFTAHYDSGTGNVILLPGAPAPENVRSAGSALTSPNPWAVQLVAGGVGTGQLLVQVAGSGSGGGGTGNVWWSCIGQVQRMTP
jgi:hypothetical protein